MRPPSRRKAVAGHVLVAVLFAFSVAPACADVIKVQIKNLGFIPARVTAHVGDTTEWVNGDFIAHTATARSGAWDVMLKAHNRAHIVVRAAGTFDYYCKFHPGMTGVITVTK